MATSVEESCGTHPDIFGVSQSLASTFQTALNDIALKSETLGSAATSVSAIAHALVLPTHSLRQPGIFTALTTWNRTVAPSLQKPVLSDSVRLSITQPVVSVAGLDEFSNITAALTADILKYHQPMRTILDGFQDVLTSLTAQMVPNESLQAITSAFANVKVSVEAETAASQATTKRSTTDGSYEQVARRLVWRLGITDEQALPSQAFKTDAAASAAAYNLIHEHAPEVAAQIDEETDCVKTSFLDRKLVRYSLASLVLILVVTLWVTTTLDFDLIPQPWRSLIRSSAEGTVVGAPLVREIARKRDKNRTNSHPGAAPEETEHE